MITLLSPSKTLDFESSSPCDNYSESSFINKSTDLINILDKLTVSDIRDLMGVSDKIAELNCDRFKNWENPNSSNFSKQALYAFKGDVYTGLEASALAEDRLDYAQQHLRIISGLYGLLRPLDLMQPYRLEMGLKLKTKKASNLYQFWGEQITDAVNSMLAKHDEPVLINLASNEYFKAIQKKNLDGRLITPLFKDWKNGEYKMISFFAKKARGMMVRYAIDHKLQELEGLQDFDYDGYRLNQELSHDDNWVFCRG